MNPRRLGLVLLVFAVSPLLFNSRSWGQEGEKPTTRPATKPQWVELPPAPEPKPIILGSLDEKKGYLFQIELIHRGAAVRNVKLRKYFVTVADKQLHAEDPARYETERSKNPEKYKGRYKLLNAAGAGDNARFALATHQLRITGLPGRSKPLEIDLEGTHWNLLPGGSPESASFVWQLDRDLNYDKPKLPRKYTPQLRIVKTYTISKSDYSIRVSLKVENLTKDHPLKVSLDQLGPTVLQQEYPQGDYRRTAAGRFDTEKERVQADLKPGSERLKDKRPGERVEVGKSDDIAQPMVWAGCTSKFFAALLYLTPGQGKQLQAPEYKATFYFTSAAATSEYLAGVSFGEREIAAGGEVTINMDVFAGPKKRAVFSEEGAPPAKALYVRLGYRNTIELRSCCWAGTTAWYIMWLLEKLSVISLGNYGVGIIILVIFVRLALHPLTKRGQVSMVKMQKLAPQMQKIKEKHKGDKEALNREMMAMYKKTGATPILGCLPMLLQMPIWIALWTGLSAAVELRHAAFLPVWITDLAAPDALIAFTDGIRIPLIGKWIYGLNLLPLLVTVAMFLQMKMNPQTAQAAPDSPQAKQTKMMMYFMPVMMLFIFYTMPSGLNMYIMTSTFAGLAEQKVIRKHIKDREAAHAAAETTVTMPGKAARDSRPKKPKGPMWFKKG